MATPTLSDFLVVPINGTDLIAFYRGSNTSRPLYLRYSTFLDILSQSIGGGTSLLLKTNGVQNPVQTILNLVDGSGMTITDDGAGNITFTSSGGASYITSTSDSADIELDVTAGDLNAVLTAIGTAGTFGDATNVPQITVDSKGRITGVTLVAITAGAGTVTSVSATVPAPTTPALSVVVTNPTTTPAIDITANGTISQYVRGDASLGTTVTKTSELYNDGDNGTSHFISLEDLPSNLTLYATDVASGISTYTKAVSSLTDPDYNTVAVNIPIGPLTSTSVATACGGVISSANIIVGNPGIFTMSTIGSIRRTAGTAEGVFFYEVYKRTSAGVESLIVTSANTNPVSSPIYVEFNAAALFNNGVFTATDRVVIKFYGLRLPGGSDPSFEFQFGGVAPVRTTLPIPLVVTPANGVTSVAALTLGTAGTDLSSTVANPTTTPVITLNVPTASALNRGVITAAQFADITAGSFGVTVDGVTSIIQIGQTGFVTMNYAGTISGWSISANAVGSIQFDIWKASGAIPTIANTIVAGVYPTLTAAQFVTSTTMTGWTLSFVAGDVFGFYVNSISTLKNATLTVRTIKS